jgi:hypothetical protein
VSIKDEKILYTQNFCGRGCSRGGRNNGRDGGGRGRGGYYEEKGQSSQQNWRGRGRGRMSSAISVANMVTMRRTATPISVTIAARSGITQKIAMPRRKWRRTLTLSQRMR